MPISFDVNIGEVFRDVVAKAETNAKIAMKGSLDAMASEAKGLAPKRTSALANSIRAGDISGSLAGGDLHGVLSATAPGAEAQEFGSGLHGERGEKYPIRPRFKKALRFAAAGSVAGGGEGFTFAKGVMHPGVKAKRYLQGGVEAKLDMLSGELSAAVALAITKD